MNRFRKQGTNGTTELVNQLARGLVDGNPKNLLNLYLVSNRLKPAASIYTSKLSLVKLHGYETEADIALLEKLGLAHNVNSPKMFRLRYEFAVAQNPVKLEATLSAETDYSFGVSLGYPKDEAMAYEHTITSMQLLPAYIQKLVSAIRANTKVPLWLAYISHVPLSLDLTKSNICPTSSELLGRDYMSFVRQTNPRLARKVERRFKREELKWYIRQAADEETDIRRKILIRLKRNYTKT